MNYFKRFYSLIFNHNLELRERVFRVVLIAASGMSLFSLAEGILLENSIVMTVTAAALFLSIIVSLLATFKFNHMEFAAFVMAFVIIVGIFPSVFFVSGGIDGGATVWFVLGIIYVFLMFTGKKFYFFLTFALLIDIATYIIGYWHPELIHPLENKFMVYLDSAFAVVLIGVSIGLIMKFQSNIYESERKITLEQKEELIKVGSAKNIFFAKISHEIRTPINTIIGLNELNLREALSPEVIENCISIQNASEMLLELVNEVLDVSQIETNKMNIILSEYNTKQLIFNLVDLMQIRMKKKNLDFYVDVDEKLPSILIGDDKRINQVMINLLTNAVKYTEKGSVSLQIRTEQQKDSHVCLIISVADTGIGIRKEDLDNLYDYFRRVDEQHNRKIEGSGLGLSITKQLVDLMGGQISVDSIYTKGTTFTIRLEQEIKDNTPIGRVNFLNGSRSKGAVQYVPSFEAPEAKILIVDDNEINLTVARKLLRDTKIKIDTAKSGAEGLELTRKKYYQVIFLDYMMPELDGADTLQEIRKQEDGLCKDTPVVCLSGNARTNLTEHSNGYKFDSYLQKPVHGEELELEILRYLPPEIVEYCSLKGGDEEEEIDLAPVPHKKRICVTAECICDLPKEYLDKYSIKQIYLYIETENGRFQDTREVDGNNISKYLSKTDSRALAVCASVEEYEAFFAHALTEAEEVVHISLARYAGKSFENAAAAAKCFDHVHVIDSGHLSGGLGLLTLYAAKIAQTGGEVKEIIAGIEQMRDRISNRFLMANAGALCRSGYIKNWMNEICNVLQLHPLMNIRNSHLRLEGLQRGRLDHARKKFISKLFRFKHGINTDIVYITHVGCSVKEVEFIVDEVRKHMQFERIIVQQTSVANACNAGMGAIGISFYRKVRSEG